ncbi:kinase-like protein [Colletotrichum eremochloae]|nr:kinase-like protein [Colletotrichum eremochloae]
MSQTTQATEPFSQGYIDSRAEAEAMAISSRIFSKFQKPRAFLHRLETKTLDYRILISSHQPGTILLAGDEWITVYPKSLGSDDHIWQCMAIPQTCQSVRCEIRAPIQCSVWYDTSADAVQVANRSEAPLEFQPHILPGADEAQPENLLVNQKGTAVINPGLWICISGASLDLQIQVFPRKSFLSLVHRRPREGRARAERRRSALSCSSEHAPYPPSLKVVRPLRSLESMSDGETALARGSSGDFTLTRIRTTSDTRAARLFEAEHSAYPGHIIVVKALRFRPEKNSSRINDWKREYGAHRKLEHKHIVKLLGGDVHLGALFLSKVDAFDLGTSQWCDRKGDNRFRGTPADARRVLQDMAAALRYLHDEELLLHNDIKPANILYDKKDGARLADFGLATRMMSPPSSGGTPWYVPPEFLSRKERKAPADVFALVIVMIYLLGYIAIPEFSMRTKPWMIAEVHDRSASPAAKAMASWLRWVRDARGQLEKATDVTAPLVLRMLEPFPRRRITACELDTAIQNTRARRYALRERS